MNKMDRNLKRQASSSEAYLETLEEIQARVLWLATRIIHEANYVRPNPDGTKVGGHQASSASMVTIMTGLYFHFLQGGDRVSVKPHASPVFHAIQYLQGKLDKEYLTQLRAYKGLQAYPSRTKDPDVVDFSTGSVGLGAVAPAFAAMAHRYAQSHFDDVPSRRFVAIMGDAELDEGNVWEALLDDSLVGLGNLLWIVDLNRQSLDRVVPGIKAARLKQLFSNCGWQVLETKYGRKLQALFAQANGELLRERIDEMSNEEYQALIRLPADQLRQQVVQVRGVVEPRLVSLLAEIPDEVLPSVISNLGGHDLAQFLEVLQQADAESERPTVIFAYTIKGWGLPFAGHPLNHSMLLNQAQIEALRDKLAVPSEDEWAAFAPDSAAGLLCQQAAQRLTAKRRPLARPRLREGDKAMGGVGAPAGHDKTAVFRFRRKGVVPLAEGGDEALPKTIDVPINKPVSTQKTFGRILMTLSRLPKISKHLITTAPDVSLSTNLSGWISKVGVYTPQERADYGQVGNNYNAWRQDSSGQHIELGISEMNLFMLLGMFGLSSELIGEHLIPIGTVYDPFVCRGLDAFIYALYSGAKFIIVGTPSGVTLSPEGGAHQSTITSSIGTELPNLNFYEPCYAQELAWIMLEALRQCYDRDKGRATYLRLSTKPIDQQPFINAQRRLGAEKLQQQALAGGYRLLDWRSADATLDKAYLVHIATTGTMIPEALEAAQLLQKEGIPANVINLTSQRRLFEEWQAMPWGRHSALTPATAQPFEWLIPANERHAPIITVNDGASHALAWLGSVFGSLVIPLGVDQFGQSGRRGDLYRHFNIDAEGIFNASLVALNRSGLS